MNPPVVPPGNSEPVYLLSLSGDTGCHPENVAQALAARLGWHAATGSDLLGEEHLQRSTGTGKSMPPRAWSWLAASVLVRLAAKGPLIYSVPGGQFLLPSLDRVIRIHLTASESFRIGTLMTELGLTRTEARNQLKKAEADQAKSNRQRFGRIHLRPEAVDAVLNVGNLTVQQTAAMIEALLQARSVLPGQARSALSGMALSQATEAQMLFQIHLKLAEFDITVAQDPAVESGPEFGHPSEEWFAKLLDFYQIAWQYEPRSFPLQWDKDGKVIEAFTPDFYLPEFDLYVELTTMRQSLVTRKNRKIKLLRGIYPHINVQVFYQKDFQDLILKYGLSRAGGAA